MVALYTRGRTELKILMWIPELSAQELQFCKYELRFLSWECGVLVAQSMHQEAEVDGRHCSTRVTLIAITPMRRVFNTKTEALMSSNIRSKKQYHFHDVAVE